MLYKRNIPYVLYRDDSILAGPDKEELKQVIKEIKKSGLNIALEGDLQDFLGGRIDRMEDGSISLTQPHLYVLYTDDSILAGPNKEELQQVIKEIKKSGLNVTVEEDLQDFLGVRIDRMEDGSISLTQPQLIDQILKDLRMDNEEVVEKDTPAMSSKILKRHQEEPAFD